MIGFTLQKKLFTAEGEVLLDVSATIIKGSFVTLYGSSGAGKTSILRMLAGLLQPDGGNIKVNNDLWFNANTRYNQPPQHRSIGFVFQDYALFPNMNVKENISFATDKNQDRKFVDELLELAGLSALAERNIQTLSGGQQQRVALARAIARKPSILLLDEPLSAVDRSMRLQLQEMLKAIHQRFSLTTVMVSHDEEEIIKLSDSIIHLVNGKFIQRTTPALFFHSNGNKSEIMGQVVSFSENGDPVILIENRLITLPTKSTFNLFDKVVIGTDLSSVRKS